MHCIMSISDKHILSSGIIGIVIDFVQAFDNLI